MDPARRKRSRGTHVVGQAAPPGFEIIASVPVCIADNLEEALLPVRRNLAMVLGGYGTREVNFNRDMAAPLGQVGRCLLDIGSLDPYVWLKCLS